MAIFRHIDNMRGRTIVLGEPFRFWQGSVPLGPGERELSPGEFGGARSIVIELDPANIVRAMRFRYAPGASFQFMRSGYQDMLGTPTVEQPDRIEWSDSDTSFTLWRDTTGDEPALHSRLEDRKP